MMPVGGRDCAGNLDGPADAFTGGRDAMMPVGGLED